MSTNYSMRSTRKKIDEIGKTLQEKLNDVVRMVRESEKMVKEAIGRLEKEAALCFCRPSH